MALRPNSSFKTKINTLQQNEIRLDPETKKRHQEDNLIDSSFLDKLGLFSINLGAKND
jgi:hypothetical protein